jgi:cytoskeletal protein CcmA (bactofilin family)
MASGIIGKGICIKGKLQGGEDLTVEGRVEGTISLAQNHLLLERSAAIEAQIAAKNVTVRGEVRGNMAASDKVEVCADARVQGDIAAPRLVMQEGARFRGSIEMHVSLPPGLLDSTSDNASNIQTSHFDAKEKEIGR